MSTNKRKVGERWTVIAMQPNGEAWPFQIGYWEVMSWPYLSQAKKIVQEYHKPGDTSTLVVVPGNSSYRAARSHNQQLNRARVCGVLVLFAQAKEWYRALPIRYCNTIARRERMMNVDGEIYELVPNTYEWTPI